MTMNNVANQKTKVVENGKQPKRKLVHEDSDEFSKDEDGDDSGEGGSAYTDESLSDNE